VCNVKANNPPSPSWADRILAHGHQRTFLALLGTNPARITPNADKGGNPRESFLGAPTYKHSLVSPPTSFARFAVRQEAPKMAATNYRHQRHYQEEQKASPIFRKLSPRLPRARHGRLSSMRL